MKKKNTAKNLLFRKPKDFFKIFWIQANKINESSYEPLTRLLIVARRVVFPAPLQIEKFL